MKPNVARFEDVEAKDRLVVDDNEGAAKLLLSMQRREGEKRIEVAALMLTDKRMQSEMAVMRREVESYIDIEIEEFRESNENPGKLFQIAGRDFESVRGVRPMRVFARSSTYHSVGG